MASVDNSPARRWVGKRSTSVSTDGNLSSSPGDGGTTDTSTSTSSSTSDSTSHHSTTSPTSTFSSTSTSSSSSRTTSSSSSSTTSSSTTTTTTITTTSSSSSSSSTTTTPTSTSQSHFQTSETSTSASSDTLYSTKDDASSTLPTTSPPSPSQNTYNSPGLSSSAFTGSNSISTVIGTVTTSNSPLSTHLADDTPLTPTQRRAIIAGSAAGFILLLLLLIGGLFYYKQRKKSHYEFLSALSAPIQQEHSRARLLAGEDMDGDNRGSGFGMGYVRTRSPGGSYKTISYPAPTTPWDIDGDPRSSIEALHHPSRKPLPSEANQYMSQYLMRSRASGSGSLFREELGEGEGPGLVDPLRSGEIDLSTIVDSVMGPGSGRPDESLVRGISPSSSYTTLPGREGHGELSRQVSGISQVPLIPSVLGYSIPAQPVQPSPLQNAIAGSSELGHTEESGGTEEAKMYRTRNWIERTLNK